MSVNDLIQSDFPITKYFVKNCGNLDQYEKNYLKQSGNILSLPSIITITRIAGGCIEKQSMVRFILEVRKNYEEKYIKEKIDAICNSEYGNMLQIMIHKSDPDNPWLVLPYMMNKAGKRFLYRENESV